MDNQAPQVLLNTDLFDLTEYIADTGITIEEGIADLERNRIQQLKKAVQEGKISQSAMVGELMNIKRRYEQLLLSLKDN